MLSTLAVHSLFARVLVSGTHCSNCRTVDVRKHTRQRASTRAVAALFFALTLVPSICLAGLLYRAEGQVLTANTRYDGGFVPGPTGAFHVTVRLPASYIPGTAFDESDEVAVDIVGPGHFNFHLDEPLEGVMPVDVGIGSFSQDPNLNADPLGMRGPGPFIWAMEFYCPAPTPGACRGYVVEGEVGEFRLLSEPSMLSVLAMLALLGMLLGYRKILSPAGGVLVEPG